MFAHPTTSPVKDSEIPFYRFAFWAGWVLIPSGLSWLFCLDPFTSPSGASLGYSVWWPIGISIFSVPIGWFLGYKKLIAPLFCGVILLNEKK